MTHFGAVDETTKRLVARCAKVKWLREEEVGAGKFLGVEMPSAMASSVSVVEVAAHTEKPGVLTPSRKEDSMREERAAENGLIPTAKNAVGEVLRAERSPFEVEGEALWLFIRSVGSQYPASTVWEKYKGRREHDCTQSANDSS